MDDLKEKYRESPNEQDVLYLLHSCSNSQGFFVMNEHILFLSKNDGENVSNTIETEKLSLTTKVQIVSVHNMPTFEPGYYNYIMFKGKDDDVDFDSFVRICSLYVQDSSEMTLKAFFFSIMSLFQMPKEQQYKNLLGVLGELVVIKDVYEESGVNIAKGWHAETTDKYDFVLGGLVLEIKTTSHNDLNVQIKHDQLYSREDVYLGAVCIEKSNAGFTLNDLIKQINTIEEFSKNLRFQIALGNELKKISPDEANQLRFDIKKIRFFKNTDIATISDIPEYLSDITYRCRLEGQKTVSIEDMISRI